MRSRRWNWRRLEEEGELAEEDQEDVITMINKVILIEIVLIQGGHGALTAEPMDTQPKTTRANFKMGRQGTTERN
jgi:hypothetical protein